MEAADAVCQGGIVFLEITMTVPGAVDVIRKLVDSVGKNVIVGAGTALDSKQLSNVWMPAPSFW
jgi:2-dehydro-3-deoxyphosphogluconate aldolase/(4S)-4-hydroxy-2-oxoglutarate aldolase